MQLLLLSSSRTAAGYFTDYLPAIRAFTSGIRSAAFIPYAAVTLPWEEYRARVAEALGIELDAQIDDADLVVVGGGNTFQLLKECRNRIGLEKLRLMIVNNNVKYLGWSAGANLACPTIRTTNDMPIVDPGGLDALGLVRFQINPHYLSVALPGHHGETRDERLREFAHANPGLPVIGLPEGDWLRVSDGVAELGGPHPAMWFEGERQFRIQPGARAPAATSNGA
jgi:dipeptidase E